MYKFEIVKFILPRIEYFIYNRITVMAYSGKQLQTLLNKLPRSLCANADITAIVADDGSVSLSGLVGNRIQDRFRQLSLNNDILDHVIDVACSEDRVYILNGEGHVFAYDYTLRSCDPAIIEIYTPTSCRGYGDRAVSIKAGAHHVVIRTAGGKVFGAGDNSQYQIVPQGACSYATATEIIVTDYVYHDNSCCDNFRGVLTLVDEPRRPAKKCSTVKCLSGNVRTECVNPCRERPCVENATATATISAFSADIGTAGNTGVITLPMEVDVSYFGTYCVCDGYAKGTITYTVESVSIDRKTFINAGIINSGATFDVTNGADVELLAAPIVGTTISFNMRCGEQLPPAVIPIPAFTTTISATGTPVVMTVVITGGPTLHLTMSSNVTAIILNSDAPAIFAVNPVTVSCIRVPCCDEEENCKEKCNPCFPQPCWTLIGAGGNITVLVDDCNRIWALGSLYQIRSNIELVKRDGLEALLSQFDTRIDFPSSQLDCGKKIVNNNCQCYGECSCEERGSKFDLNKFGISVNIPAGSSPNCASKCQDYDKSIVTACDFIRQLRKIDEEPENCKNTCIPCDGTITVYFDCECDDAFVPDTVTIYNRNSICKALNPHFPEKVFNVDIEDDNIVDYNLSTYCVNGVNVCLDDIIVLDFGRITRCSDNRECRNLDIFVDLDRTPRSIKFTTEAARHFTLDFPVFCSKDLQTVLNYGGVMDPLDLERLRSLYTDSVITCKKYTNPPEFRLIDVYAQGGDHVRLINARGRRTRVNIAVTADLPVVFDLRKQVVDVAVGFNNLSVLTGGLICGNEVYAIGQNCWGQLGLNSYVTSTCFKRVNPCYFNCQVSRIFAGPTSTFYVTQDSAVYASGEYPTLTKSVIPKRIDLIPRAWKTKTLAVNQNTIVLLGGNGNIYGYGENQLGQLGLGHTQRVCDFYLINWCKIEFDQECERRPRQCVTEKCCTTDACGNKVVIGGNNGNRNYVANARDVREVSRDLVVRNNYPVQQVRRGNGCAPRVIEEKCCQRPLAKVEVSYERGREGGCGCRRPVCGCERREPGNARVVRDCCDNGGDRFVALPVVRRGPQYPGVRSKLLNPYGKAFYQSRGYDSSINVDYED